jgi:predicted  nucleic acid-binding Zn-ribbon protein
VHRCDAAGDRCDPVVGVAWDGISVEIDSMTDQERITALELRVENHFQSALRLGEAIVTLRQTNQYLDAKISSVQDRIGRLEAENTELRRRIGLPEQ